MLAPTVGLMSHPWKYLNISKDKVLLTTETNTVDYVPAQIWAGITYHHTVIILYWISFKVICLKCTNAGIKYLEMCIPTALCICWIVFSSLIRGGFENLSTVPLKKRRPNVIRSTRSKRTSFKFFRLRDNVMKDINSSSNRCNWCFTICPWNIELMPFYLGRDCEADVNWR